MEDAKYEKNTCVNENIRQDPSVVCDNISKLIYCMFETNKKNNETAYRFCLETASTPYHGTIRL